jgi:hypothetical protein
MTDDKQRPLWRIGTRTLAAELKRRSDAESVQRAFLSECDLTLLLAEVVARGYNVTPPMVVLKQKWPPLADDDAE